jgi:ureidoacrylate peracid hydrolase
VTLSGKPAIEDWKPGALSKVVPEQTALLVIDLQRDFCNADGALARLGSDVSPCSAAAERVAGFLPKARPTLGLTAFFQLIYDAEMMSESQRERLIRNGRPILCAPGTPGVELVISPGAEDFVFTKNHYSAFSNDRFCQLLHERSVTSVAVVGVDTHICVEGTIRHGYDLGYRMIVLPDLVATRQSEFGRHEDSLAMCERYFALSLNSTAFLELLRTKNALHVQMDSQSA